MTYLIKCVQATFTFTVYHSYLCNKSGTGVIPECADGRRELYTNL